MSSSIFGQVVGVRKFSDGTIEVEFYHEDEITEFRYSPNADISGNLMPKILAESLSSTLASNICVEIYFGDDGVVTHIELEECDDDLEECDDLEEDGDLEEDDLR